MLANETVCLSSLTLKTGSVMFYDIYFNNLRLIMNTHCRYGLILWNFQTSLICSVDDTLKQKRSIVKHGPCLYRQSRCGCTPCMFKYGDVSLIMETWYHCKHIGERGQRVQCICHCARVKNPYTREHCNLFRTMGRCQVWPSEFPRGGNEG